MAVNITSGLTALVNGVRSYFTGAGLTANVSVGWKEAAKQVNQGTGRANRVVFVPSDLGGRGGTLTAVQQPGQRNFGTPTVDTAVRALQDWERTLLVRVWAVDSTSPNDEEKQIEAVETLFEWTIRAVQSFAKNNGRWGAVEWLAAPIERQFGRELQAELVYRHPLFDAPQVVIFPQAGPITKVIE